jgi:hypothetical protein
MRRRASAAHALSSADEMGAALSCARSRSGISVIVPALTHCVPPATAMARSSRASTQATASTATSRSSSRPKRWRTALLARPSTPKRCRSSLLPRRPSLPQQTLRHQRRLPLLLRPLLLLLRLLRQPLPHLRLPQRRQTRPSSQTRLRLPLPHRRPQLLLRPHQRPPHHRRHRRRRRLRRRHTDLLGRTPTASCLASARRRWRTMRRCSSGCPRREDAALALSSVSAA